MAKYAEETKMAEYAKSHTSFPVAVLCRGELGSLESSLRSLLAVRGITADSIVVVQTDVTQASQAFAQEIGVKVTSSLNNVFDLYPSSPALVVAKEGLLFSPDAMEFFMAVAPAVERDPTLWTVSASNRNALPCDTYQESLLLQRTGAFPGPAWLLTRTIWEQQTTQAQQRLSSLDDPGPEWSRGREAVFPETPRAATKDGVRNEDASLQWPTSEELERVMVLADYDARLGARLGARNTIHVSRVGEIPVAIGPDREFALWYVAEKGEQHTASELARHFGIWKEDIAQGSHNGVHDLVLQGTRVLLINALQQTALLHYKPPGLVALTSKQAAASQSPARACAVRQCRWTVIAGDSNLRRVTESWLKQLTKSKMGIARKARRDGMKYSSPYCEDRWAGDEWILSDDHGCHIITQRFISTDRMLSQLATDVKNSSYCGRKLLSPLRTNERRPNMPELIWFGHGMWDLPNNGTTAQNLTCTNRFARQMDAIQHWQASSKTQVVWQTNFPIVSHSTIRNEYLNWEIACQRQIALEKHIPIFDLAKFIEGHPGAVENFHITGNMAVPVAQMVDKVANQSDKHTASDVQGTLSAAVEAMHTWDDFLV